MTDSYSQTKWALEAQTAHLLMETPVEEILSGGARRTSRRRLQKAGLSAVLAAVAAATAVISLPGGSSPAFAVETASDGDVVVTVYELRDGAQLEQSLRDRGVNATVDFGKGTRVCALGRRLPTERVPQAAELTHDRTEWTVTIPQRALANHTAINIGTDSNGNMTLSSSKGKYINGMLCGPAVHQVPGATPPGDEG